MYVRWKVLLGLGTIFWILLCLSDYLPIGHIDNLLGRGTSDAKEERSFNVIQEHHVISEEPIVSKPELPHVDEGNFEFIKVIIWNLVAFASTITICFVLKSMSSRLNIINNQPFLPGYNDKLAIRKSSSSRIPIPITSKSSSTDIHVEGVYINAQALRETECNKSCPNLLGSQELEEKPKGDAKVDKKIWSIKIMEQHCSNLREEMINLQATALKEQVAVTKKMDTLTRDKKDLTKQLNVISKENKSLKQQIDDIIEERAMLIKRLESATKEMKTATKNKRATVAKLDEAVANAETLKMNLEFIKRDKVILEDKLIILDAEYKRLREEVELHRGNEEEIERRLSKQKKTEEPVKEHVIDKYDFDCEEKHRMTQTEEYDVCQSEQDIKKVQEKLLTLERSLESFKLRHDPKETLIQEKDSNESLDPECSKSDEVKLSTACLYSGSNSRATIEDQPSTVSICTELDCPLEHNECLKAECFLRKKVDEADISSGEDIYQVVQYRDYISLKKRLPKLKSSISDDRLSVISERATSTCDDSGDEWSEPKRRIVSHSPAFKKFLREILETEQSGESRRNQQNT